MRVSRRGSQALALGTGVAALLAIVAPSSNAAAVTLAVVKTAPANATVGTPFQIGLAVTAGATPTDSPTTVTDTLPAGLAFQSVSADAGTTCSLSNVPALNTITCIIPAGLANTASNITITAVATAQGAYNNQAVATPGPMDTGNPATSNQTVTQATGTAMDTCFGSAPTIVTPEPVGHQPTVIDGTNGDDVIIGTRGNDIIDGEGGNDKICGEGGNDRIYGGSGDDKIAGGRGSDFLDGGAGHNTLRGGRDSFGFNSMSTASADGRWRGRDHDHDTLVCQRRVDDCRSGFDGFGDRGRRHGDHGDNDRIIWVPERDRRDGDFRDFSAGKAAPAKPHAKPDAKPVSKPDAQPVAKPLPKPDAPSAPAVAGTEPVAPKA